MKYKFAHGSFSKNVQHKLIFELYQYNLVLVLQTLFLDTHPSPKHVSRDSCAQFNDEDETQEDGERHGHAVGLLDGAAATEEGDAKDDASYHHQQDRGVEKRVPKEVQVLAVQPLDHRTSHDQDQTCELQKKW